MNVFKKWLFIGGAVLIVLLLIRFGCNRTVTKPQTVFIEKPDTKAIDSISKINDSLIRSKDSAEKILVESQKKLYEVSKKAERFAYLYEVSKRNKDTVLMLESCDSLHETVVKQEAIISAHIEYENQLKERSSNVEKGLVLELDKLKEALGLSVKQNDVLVGKVNEVQKINTKLQRKVNNKLHVSLVAGYGASYNGSSGVRVGPIGGFAASYTIF